MIYRQLLADAGLLTVVGATSSSADKIAENFAAM